MAAVSNCTREEYQTFLAEVNYGTILDVRQLGVSLKAGSSPTNPGPHTCSLFIVMAARSGKLMHFEPKLCNQVTNEKSVQHGLHRGSITLVTEYAPSNAFSPWSADLIGSLNDMSRLKDIGGAALHADDCCIGGSSKKLPQMLQKMCSAGLLSWKIREGTYAKLNFQLYLAQREALEPVFDNAKILCMTVDGFIQCASGEGMLSRYITPYEVVASGVDEAHQLEHSVVSAICARCRNVASLWDEGQRIQYLRVSNQLSQRTILAEGSVFPWEKAVYGGTRVAILETMSEREIANLKYTWRFGPAPALYLREVEEIYQSQTVGSWSPRDADVQHHFSQAEFDRVPETVLRFVTYRGANFDAGRI